MSFWDTALDVSTFGQYGALTGNEGTLAGSLGWDGVGDELMPGVDPLGLKGSSPAPKYGETRSGGGPNRDNYYLGGSQGYAADLAQQYQNAGREQQNQQHGYAVGMQNTGANAASAQTGLAQQAGNYGTAAGNRGISNVGYGGAAFDANAQRTSAGQMGGYADQFQRMSQQGEGPSAAQAQLQSGTNQALSGQLALMRSGGTAGQTAAAADNARFNSAGIQANQANASAALRAQETAAHRDRQMGALGMAGQMQGAAAGIYGQGADRATQQAQFNAQNRLAQQQANDQTALAGWNQASQSYGAGYGQQLAAQQAASQASGAGYNAYYQGMQGGLAGQMANLQGSMGYEGDLGNIYGAELTHQTNMRGLDQQVDRDRAAAASGTIEAFGEWIPG